MTVHNVVMGLLVAVGMGGCSTSTSVETPEVIAMASEVLWTFQEETVEGRFTISVENRGDMPVLVNGEPCGFSLQRFEDGQWRGVWAPQCTLVTSLVEIAAGASFSFPVRVHAVLGGIFALNWREPLDGDYRARVVVFGPGDQTSAAFTNAFPFP